MNSVLPGSVIWILYTIECNSIYVAGNRDLERGRLGTEGANLDIILYNSYLHTFLPPVTDQAVCCTVGGKVCILNEMDSVYSPFQWQFCNCSYPLCVFTIP